MQCNAHDEMIKCNTQANDMATTTNNWQTPGASDPGRYNWLIFLTLGMIMTTALQFSVYDMCHYYNNLNFIHTLNMIVYFCPFGLQFELLYQTQMRWPS